MTRILLALASLLLLSTPALAAEVDAAASTISWRGSKITGDFHDGQIAVKSSQLKLTRGVLSSGTIVFDMTSITVGNLTGEWKDKFLGHIKSADFFEVAKFPTATLSIDSYKKGTMMGQLTIKGVSQPISFLAKKAGKTYTGKVSFDRTKFGIIYGSGNFFKNLGDKLINDTVEVEFTLSLKGT